MAAIDLIRQARNRIADKKHWTTGALARDAYGHRVGPKSDEAVCWCALGALRRGAKEASDVSRACVLLGHSSAWLSEINDRLGHQAVLDMFDKAINEEETPCP